MARKKSQRANEIDRLAKLAEKIGVNLDSLLEEVPLTEVGPEAVIRRQIEAESVLFYIETKGRDFKSKKCKDEDCNRPFLHTYWAVEYCSEECRAYALAKKGIVWNIDRRSDSQRWDIKGKGYVPKVIGPAATDALLDSGNLFTELPEED